MNQKNVIKVELIKPTMQPTEGRLFCIGVQVNSMKRRSGLMLPAAYKHSKYEKEGQVVRHIRFFVIAVGPQCEMSVVDPETKQPRNVRPGDEVYPFVPSEAIHIGYNMITDYDNEFEQYYIWHYTEIAGIKPTVIVEEEKEKEEEKKEEE